MIETTMCVMCDESNLSEYAEPNAKDVCVFCVESEEL
jgi:hypothetical protein